MNVNKKDEKKINQLMIYIKEAYYIAAGKILQNREIRPFDIVTASCNLGTKWKSSVIQYLTDGILGNISGIVINKSILSPGLLQEYDGIGTISSAELYVWYTTPIELDGGGIGVGQRIRRLATFVREYKDVTLFRMTNNICDRRYLQEIKQTMNGVFRKYAGEKYDFSLLKILNRIISCVDLYDLFKVAKTNGVSSSELIFAILSEFNEISINPEVAEIHGHKLGESALRDIYTINSDVDLAEYIKNPY